MALTHERAFRVRQYECDAYGHVNHANYLRYMQETAFDASAATGYDLDRYSELQRARLVRSRRAYELRSVTRGEVVAHATTDWVFMNYQTGRPRPGRSLPSPLNTIERPH